MLKHTVQTFFFTLLFSFFTSCSTSSSNEETTSSAVTINQHHQGQNCLNCHSSANSSANANGKTYLSAGTVYTTLDGDSSDKYALGYRIQLKMDTGNLITFNSGKGSANSNSGLSNNLLNITYSSNSFTPRVLDSNGVVVKSSNSTNSHDVSTHLQCNSCHSSTAHLSSARNIPPGRITNN